MRKSLLILLLVSLLATPATAQQIVSAVQVRLGSTPCLLSTGSGSPEGVVAASCGTYWDTTNKTVYEKRAGTGNTGWVLTTTATLATTATNLAGGILGSLPYQSAVGTTVFLAGNTGARKYLRSAGLAGVATAPTWDSLYAIDVGLENVTNESKATMFTSPAFTGTVTMPTGLNGLLFGTAGVVSTKAIGTDVQAYDAELAGLAALSYVGTPGYIRMTAAGTFSLDALASADTISTEDKDAEAGPYGLALLSSYTTSPAYIYRDGDGGVKYSPATDTLFAGILQGGVKVPAASNIWFGPDATETRYVGVDEPTVGLFAGALVVQAGESAAAAGGALNLFGHSHATRPGWIVAGISSGSGGRFAVNSQALGGGTDVFTVDAAGLATAVAFAGPLTGNVTGNASGSAASFTGNLAGDVTGTQGATVVGNDSHSHTASTVPSSYTALAITTMTGNVTGNVSGTAASITGNLSGDVTSTGMTTAIASGAIVNDDINASAGIADTKLSTIATAGKVNNSATTATSANTASAIVARDGSGGFSMGALTVGTVTASGTIQRGDSTAKNVQIKTDEVSAYNNGAAADLYINPTGGITHVGAKAQFDGTSHLDVYGGTGTHQWDIYLHSTNLRISDNTGGGVVVIDTGVSMGALAATTGTFSGAVTVARSGTSAQVKLERTSTSAGSAWIGADADNFTLFDSAFNTRLYVGLSTGNTTLVGDLAVNGDDITSDGDLTITPAGGDVIVASRLTVNHSTAGSGGVTIAKAGDPPLYSYTDGSGVGWTNAAPYSGGALHYMSGSSHAFYTGATYPLYLAPTYMRPATGYSVDIGLLGAKYKALHAAELFVETLVAQDVMATIGGRVNVAPTTVLTSDMPSTDTAFYAKHNNLAAGDIVRMEAGGQVEFISITGGPTYINATLLYQYTCTRNLDGTGANNWTAGGAVLNTGTTGDGLIDLYSTQGILSGYGPSIVGNVRNSGTWNDISTAWAIGNLNGLYDYSADIYGVGLGKYLNGSAYMTVDPTNGIRMWQRAGGTNTERFRIAADGSGFLASSNISWTAAGALSVGTWTVDSTYLHTTSGSGAGMSPADYPFFAGAAYASRASAPFRVTNAGAVTAVSGAIGGFTLASSTLSSGTDADFVAISSAGTNAFWAGDSTFADAEFSVTAAGALKATSATISGTINTGPTLTGYYATLGATDSVWGTVFATSAAGGMSAAAFRSALFTHDSGGAVKGFISTSEYGVIKGAANTWTSGQPGIVIDADKIDVLIPGGLVVGSAAGAVSAPGDGVIRATTITAANAVLSGAAGYDLLTTSTNSTTMGSDGLTFGLRSVLGSPTTTGHPCEAGINPSRPDFVLWYGCAATADDRRTSDYPNASGGSGQGGIWGANLVVSTLNTTYGGINADWTLYGFEVDVQNLTADGSSVPVAWALNGKVGFASALASNTMTQGDGSAAFAATISGTNADDRWRYAYEAAGARMASFYARRTTATTGAIAVDPEFVIYSEQQPSTAFMHSTYGGQNKITAAASGYWSILTNNGGSTYTFGTDGYFTSTYLKSTWLGGSGTIDVCADNNGSLIPCSSPASDLRAEVLDLRAEVERLKQLMAQFVGGQR